MAFHEKLNSLVKEGKFTPLVAEQLGEFYDSWSMAINHETVPSDQKKEIFDEFASKVEKEVHTPYSFPLFHEKMTLPDDYDLFGKKVMGPLVLLDESKRIGLENADKMVEQIENGENVIFFGNHQIEPDPVMIKVLLEETHPKLVDRLIFVAGHRVTTDPLAIPFSRGCNLLCIYSKKYGEEFPSKREAMLHHNQQTLRKAEELLSKGGQAIYLAPSGGRDRKGPSGQIEVANFDPQSVEMFRLIAKKAKTPTHFYPLALSSFRLLPPPQSIKREIGEQRIASRTPVHIALGKEIDMDRFQGSDDADRKAIRVHRAKYIHQMVVDLYNQF